MAVLSTLSVNASRLSGQALDSWETIVKVALLSWCLASLASYLWQWFKLRQFKGPASCGLSKIWQLRQSRAGTIHVGLMDVCEKYGSIARIGPNDLVTNEPDLWKRIFSVRSQYRRSEFFDAFRWDPSTDISLTMKDNTKHAEEKAKLVHGYSGKDVASFEEKIDENLQAFCRLIDEKYLSSAQESRPFDMARKIQYYTLDAAMDIAFGKPLGCLEHDSDVFDYIHAVDSGFQKIAVVSTYPGLVKVLGSPLFKWILPSDKDEAGVGRIMREARNAISARFTSEGEIIPTDDILGSWLKHDLSGDQAQAEATALVVGGSDSTAASIRTIILYVIANSRVNAALIKEISEVRPSSPIQLAETNNMPYLQATIKESMRIFPPIGSPLFRKVPKEGEDFNGQHIPGGTNLGMDYWGLYRKNKELWGGDPEVFRPERWLDAEPERLREMEHMIQYIFGYGRWQCLGKTIAMMEINKAAIELIRRYEFEIVDPTNPWKAWTATFTHHSDMWLRAIKRDKPIGM
ncbi:pisatin demethylase [Mariannaea sp. PMI_226]|nr:pisatin demethylase [Mariannaea sp. PMI_226]